MEVEVLKDWGRHSKGDVLQMPESTALACVAHKVVKIKGEQPDEKATTKAKGK